MKYFFAAVTHQGKVKEAGWMLAADGNELIEYARAMGYGIDFCIIGEANMSATFPEILEPLTQEQIDIHGDILLQSKRPTEELLEAGIALHKRTGRL